MGESEQPMGPEGRNATLTSSWSGLDELPVEEALAVGSSIAGYRIVRLLGRGGMGLVYEAEDTRTGTTVALKTLHRMHKDTRDRLKAEFRELAQIRHPSLVHLYEMHSIGRHAFFTMQHVRGLHLLDYLQSATVQQPSTHARYKPHLDVFRQLAQGVLALHHAGLVHLDLKPENILVDDQGHVKILDFGLAKPVPAPEPETGPRIRPQRVAGTPAYMAPEVAAGDDACEASDWYAVGVMLHEALAGQRPAGGGATAWPKDVPPSLRALCQNMLRQDPRQRPDATDIAAVLDLEPAARSGADTPRPAFVGRHHEVSVLTDYLAAAVQGTPAWLDIIGESGIGKSALISHFIAELASSDVTVLQGCCYEREAMPYQGIDGVIDGIAHALSSRDLDSSLRASIATASTAFPSLSHLVGGTPAPQDATDPQARRREVLGAVKDLVSALCAHQTVIVVLDDVHWGGGDSARMLAEILSAPTPKNLLVACARRPDTAVPSGFVPEVAELLAVRGTDASRTQLALGRLSRDEADELLRSTVTPIDEDRCDAILDAAQGLPFLVHALEQCPPSSEQLPGLDSLLRQSIDEIPHDAMSVLQAIAVCSAPLTQRVALRQGRGGGPQETLAALRHKRLVRSCGDSPDGPLEMYHGLFTQAVRATMTSERQQALRLQLARSMEQDGPAASEQLADLYFLGGAIDDAVRHGRAAAQRAEASLAFDSAAAWYGRLSQWMTSRNLGPLKDQARCLELAGRNAQAAECYEQAMAHAGADTGELARAAGAAWLTAGHIDRGLAVLTPELRTLGIVVPKSERAAMMRVAALLLRLWRRTTSFEAKTADEQPATTLSAIDASFSAAKGIGIVMVMRGLCLHLESLLLALKAGEPVRIARSLAFLSPALCGGPLDGLGEQLLARAEKIAQDAGSQYLDGNLEMSRALATQARWGSPREVRRRAGAGLRILRDVPNPTGWEEGMAAALELKAAEQLGDLGALALARDWLAESFDRGDLFAQTMASHTYAVYEVARGQLASARHHAQAPLSHWAQAEYTVQHYNAARLEIFCLLHANDWAGAQAHLRQQWPAFERAQLLRIPISAAEIRMLQGIVETGAMAASRKGARERVKLAARELAKSSSPGIRAHATLLRAAVHALEGRPLQAQALLNDATSAYEHHGMALMAACCRMRQAEFSADGDGLGESSDRLEAMGIVEPSNYINVHTPVFAAPAVRRK